MSDSFNFNPSLKTTMVTNFAGNNSKTGAKFTKSMVEIEKNYLENPGDYEDILEVFNYFEIG
jgi:hypothetical protein